MVSRKIDKLVEYGIQSGLTPKNEAIYTRNLLLDLLQEDFYEETEGEAGTDSDLNLEYILKELLDEAVEKGIIEDTITQRDLFDTKLMNTLLPRPNQVIEKFWNQYQIAPKEATDYYYQFSQDSDYIRRYRVSKDLKWKVNTEYGEIDITINLSKPEKDPKAIAAAKKATVNTYPKCLLCMENEGYAGRIDHPARENHRVIPLQMNSSLWGLQYSPYVYYNEHCIVFNGKHQPMKIERDTFVKLLDFVKQFPHYFLGSNADLPIVGGSILSHDHFQGGHYEFAMAKAPISRKVEIEGYEDVSAGIVKWPLSVLRISSKNPERLIEMANHVLETWIEYKDEEAFIFPYTKEERHNTITPIARYVNDAYELDLVLRNNITTEESPLGVYHPRNKYHHIKKENIGLIEVMGLAVLPSRLKTEMELLEGYILEGKSIEEMRENKILEKHADWVSEFLPNYDTITKDNISEILQEEIGQVFKGVLEDAGVFKQNKEGETAFLRFIAEL
ncbi:UDPglucose--hexose-1-phosphate uridylyltransferase [Aequitasia blattaphilus]|uniref:Galactose-1-phosphate uridylyltransferase n=1 Tax=Aequitasia blattaphilus TaxID=2949332 RepID=A0ABT1E804_9FIRM|nr:UDP-glucose--hexose-1-phosphate uridylyltransferase [Aequitasia blattaphilus]MCP1101754.1 UDP-glucose--hexose-1-phosphate uridylyltransferase [Aequitasia blattaphilus]MCR8614394.1 UDP-glucose--hexose-1-phosphate uridylyltransferase [Aequitasia blattaphilus]